MSWKNLHAIIIREEYHESLLKVFVPACVRMCLSAWSYANTRHWLFWMRVSEWWTTCKYLKVGCHAYNHCVPYFFSARVSHSSHNLVCSCVFLHLILVFLTHNHPKRFFAAELSADKSKAAISQRFFFSYYLP